jgi:hypothetical protein
MTIVDNDDDPSPNESIGINVVVAETDESLRFDASSSSASSMPIGAAVTGSRSTTEDAGGASSEDAKAAVLPEAAEGGKREQGEASTSPPSLSSKLPSSLDIPLAKSAVATMQAVHPESFSFVGASETGDVHQSSSTWQLGMAPMMEDEEEPSSITRGAVAVRGPGAITYDREQSRSSDDNNENDDDALAPSMATRRHDDEEPIRAEIVTTTTNIADVSDEVRHLIESQVREEIQRQAARAVQVVAVVVDHEDSVVDDDGDEESQTPSPVPPSSRTSGPKGSICLRSRFAWLLLLLFMIGGGVVTTVVLLVKTKRQSPKQRLADPLPKPAIVDFLLNVSYDKSIRYPFPALNLTAAERALQWIYSNINELVPDDGGNGKNVSGTVPAAAEEQTSLIQKFVLATLYFQSTESSSSPQPPNGTSAAWVTPLATNKSSECTAWLREPQRVQCRGDNGQIDALDLNMVVGRGTIPQDLGLLTQLTSLILDENELSGPLPSELGMLSRLTYFSVERNKLVGSIPTELATWVDLEQLVLTFNRFGGSIPTIFSTSFAKLTKLILQENSFTGPVANVIGNWTRFRELDIHQNDFTGSIPTTIAKLEWLDSIHGGGNKLSGTLPSELAQLTRLYNIYLPNNGLTGTLPSELGVLTRMEFFDVFENRFVGTLPTEYGQWTKLGVLGVEHNDLSGTIPTEYAAWTVLRDGQLQGNNLTIDVNLPICSPVLSTLSVDCEDKDWCECCTYCYSGDKLIEITQNASSRVGS